MFKKLLIASLAASALALQAPAALADPAAFDCGFNSVAQETATGGQDTYTGVAYGYVAQADANVTIRCTIEVDGTEVASTPVGSGNGFASTQGPIAYTATDDQDVKLCAWWTVSNPQSNGKVCFETTNTQVPPQEVIDALDTIFDIIAEGTIPVDLLLCGTLTSLGVPALVNSATSLTTISMGADCDIFLGGELLLDFYPYEP